MLIAAAFALASTTFAAGATIPKASVYTRCGGENRSPELHWSGAPTGTKSFALIVHDPDAPHAGGWYHWVLYNIAPRTHGIPYDRTLKSATAGVNDFQDGQYDGPCPPPGKPHHYHFRLYALDVAHIAGAKLTATQLERAMARHILAQTTLTGLYGT